MAVKPITNPNPEGKDQINRAKQVSNKDTTTSNTGNERQVVTPGADSTKNFEIVLQDLDKAIMSHVKNVMILKARENGEVIDIPILYGNEERWANVRRRGAMRDENGTLILPMIMFKRTSVDFNTDLPSWKHDLKNEFIQVMRSSKWSGDNKYTRFGVQQGQKPVEENIITGVPQYIDTVYSFVAVTSYITQMNSIIESFLQQSGTYWGDNTSYRFLCNVDGSINDATEMDIDTDRIIKTEFSIKLNGYLLPEVIASVVQNKKFNATKQITYAKVNFSEKIE